MKKVVLFLTVLVTCISLYAAAKTFMPLTNSISEEANGMLPECTAVYDE